MTTRSRLSRHTFFDLVWAQPMTKVAARLGISDVALKKICVRHHVPVPGRGYWAKVAGGKHVKGAALASTSDPMLEEVEIYGSQLLLPPKVWRAKREATGDDQASERKIIVSPVTGLLHPNGN